MQNLKTDLNTIEQEQKERRANLTQCEQAVVRHGKVTSRLRIESQQAQDLVEELQDALDRDAVQEGKLDVLKEQLTEAQGEKETYESTYEDSVVAKDTNYKAVKATRGQLAELDELIKEAEAQLLKAENKAGQRALSREVALREKNAALEAVENEKERRQMTQAQRDEKTIEIEDFTRQASEHHERVPIEKGETCDKLEAKLHRLKFDLSRAEARYLCRVSPPLP